MDQMIEHELLPRGPRKVHEPIYMCIYSRDDDTIYIYIFKSCHCPGPKVDAPAEGGRAKTTKQKRWLTP